MDNFLREWFKVFTEFGILLAKFSVNYLQKGYHRPYDYMVSHQIVFLRMSKNP